MSYHPMPPLGQAAMAASLPVVFANNQSTLPVSLASVPLPTGAATEATLSAMSAKLPASLGQKLMAASLAVVLASDQSALPVTGAFYQATQPVSAATLPLPTGASTEATLAAVSGKLPATLGQKAMAASMAVVLASDQTAIPVTQSGAWNVGTVTTVTTVSTVTNLAQLGGQAISMNTGVRDGGTQRVTIATNDLVPISAASLPLPTGASTEATLSAVSGKLPASLGQKAMVASLAVVIASDQSAIPVSQSGAWSVTVAAGAAIIGNVRIDQTTPGTTNGVVVNYTADSVGASTQITAIDAVVAAPGDNGISRGGASTAGSYVAVAVKEGQANWLAGIGGGTWTTTLYFEGSNNSTNGLDGNWWGITMSQEGENDNVVAASVTSASITTLWRGPCAGLTYVRVRAVGGTITSGPNILLRCSAGTSVVNLSEPIPTGANIIGALVANQSINVAQIVGTAASVNAGAPDAGTQRVAVAHGALGIGKAEDSASANLDVGVPIMIVRRATPVAGTDTDGDYELAQGQKGRQYACAPNEIGAATTITALDAVVGAPAGAGAVVSGASTAGSLVALAAVGGEGTFTVFISGGSYTGTIYWEGSVNSTNGTDGSWISLQARRLGIAEMTLLNGHAAAGAAVSSIYRGGMAGFTYFRARLVGSVFTTAPTITLALSQPGASAPIIPPTITKGTQGTTGVTTQNLKDAGRAIVNAATAIAGVTCVTVEALLSLNFSRDCAATAAGTSIAVTAGKRLRVLAIVVGIRSTGAAVLSGRISLRMNPAGAVAATSPIIAIASLSQKAAALAEAGSEICIPLPDGIEFSGTQQFGLTQVCSAITGVVYASIIGYEY